MLLCKMSKKTYPPSRPYTRSMARNNGQDVRLPSIMSGMSMITDEVRAAWREAAREVDNDLSSQKENERHTAGQSLGRERSVNSDGSGLAHGGGPTRSEKGLAHSSGPIFASSEEARNGEVNRRNAQEIDLTGAYVHHVDHRHPQPPFGLAHWGGPDTGLDDISDNRAGDRPHQGRLTREALQDVLAGMLEQGDHDGSPPGDTHWGDQGPASHESGKGSGAMNDPAVPRELSREEIAHEVIRAMTGLLSTQNKSNESAAPQGRTDHGNQEYRMYHSEPNVRGGSRNETPCRAYKSARNCCAWRLSGSRCRQSCPA